MPIISSIYNSFHSKTRIHKPFSIFGPRNGFIAAFTKYRHHRVEKTYFNFSMRFSFVRLFVFVQSHLAHLLFSISFTLRLIFLSLHDSYPIATVPHSMFQTNFFLFFFFGTQTKYTTESYSFSFSHLTHNRVAKFSKWCHPESRIPF